ncbi:MAG: cytochrome c maturation protein CcmE [SAR202 cluster bacterium]|nr:cytochrome c maturation protein CcmE [SAR202 cluster bacterium]
MTINKIKIIIISAVFALAFSYFAFMALTSATMYYYTVSELQTLDPSSNQDVIRVSGKLVPSSYNREVTSTISEFTITDGTNLLKTQHDGILPDLFFNKHSEIILQGTLTKEKTFITNNVTVKCPSKYISENPSRNV